MHPAQHGYFNRLLTSFFSARGLTVITNEVLWIWLPACLFALAMVLT